MKKLSILVALISPMAAFAIDLSDCEKIGYWQNTDTTCQMYEDCVAWHKDAGMDNYAEDCADRPKTAEDCMRQIEKVNAESVESEIVMKCPVTDARLAHKNAPKTSGAEPQMIITDGGIRINIDDLIADADHVYYTNIKMLAGMPDVWRAFGTRDKESNMFLSVAE